LLNLLFSQQWQCSCCFILRNEHVESSLLSYIIKIYMNRVHQWCLVIMTLSSRLPSFSPSFWIDGIININGFGCVSRSAPVPTIATVLFLLLQKCLMISRVMIRPFSTDIIRNRRWRCCGCFSRACRRGA
jgi:hypothetical protein